MVIIALLSIGGFSQSESEKKYNTSDGMGISVRLSAEKAQIMIGEPIYLIYEAKPIDDEIFSTPVGGDYRNKYGRPDSYTVKATRSDGLIAKHENVIGFGGLSGSQLVTSDKPLTTRLFLPHWVEFEKPGKYFITVSKSLSVKRHSAVKGVDNPSKNISTSVGIELEVLAKDSSLISKLIDDWGIILLDKLHPKNKDATLMLDNFKDAQTKKYFIRALESFTPDETDFFSFEGKQLIHALAYFDDDIVMDAFADKIASKNGDIRYAIAASLTRSSHPRSFSILIALQDDENNSVRLRVAQKFSKIKTEEVMSLMEKYLNDKYLYVRQIAQEYIGVTVESDIHN